MSDCEHLDVKWDQADHEWRCVEGDCGLKFMPVLAAIGMAEERTDEITAIASAMLWDFHQRAVEHYGEQVSGAVAPNREAFEFSPDTCVEHEFDSGACSKCGTSQFLGGE